MARLTAEVAQWRAKGSCVQVRGQRVFVMQGGNGPTLLLIHGYPTSSYDWFRVWAPLAQHFTLIAPDMLGMGFSSKPKDFAYGVQTHADLMDALLQTLGVRRMHIMAHDLGVSVAQEMLARRLLDTRLPAIGAMVLLNGGVCPEAYQPRAIQHLLSSPLGRWVGPRIPQRAFNNTIKKLFGPNAPPSQQLLNSFWALVCHDQGREITHLVSRFYIDRLALRDRLVAPLVAHAVPVRLINGAADPNSGHHMAERYRAVVPKADIVSLEGVGHWPQIEAPEAVVKATRDLLETCRRF